MMQFFLKISRKKIGIFLVSKSFLLEKCGEFLAQKYDECPHKKIRQFPEKSVKDGTGVTLKLYQASVCTCVLCTGF